MVLMLCNECRAELVTRVPDAPGQTQYLDRYRRPVCPRSNERRGCLALYLCGGREGGGWNEGAREGEQGKELVRWEESGGDCKEENGKIEREESGNKGGRRVKIKEEESGEGRRRGGGAKGKS
ncbi:hypothetical protein Pcinc_040181 [Petrolisthes cinctipes]|uniref:Uncharacterized protein n=1 Tax=Petrolisthes cinctipes TaxID=88211 RepID=A0AAE1BLY0_PETCI|nr:hypothetical protein Pcinc_040181 [Petrolisthes cinctipes]